MWRAMISDLVAVRIVNGQRKDGTLVPLLVSVSELMVAKQRYFAILFEQMHKQCALVVVDELGIVSNASDNVKLVLSCTPEQMAGRPINSWLIDPPPRHYLRGAQIDPNEQIAAVSKPSSGPLSKVCFCLFRVSFLFLTSLVKTKRWCCRSWNEAAGATRFCCDRVRLRTLAWRS
jgi:hypothetical protein